MESLSHIFVPLSLVATAVMAASAAIQARRFSLDLFGATVLGIVTAVGGGTLRDLLLGLTPVFWITDLRFLLVAVPSAMLSFYIAARMPTGNGRRLALLMYLDAIGLALFTLTGVQVALGAGVSPVLAIVIGCVTGTAGGMIRDLLCNITPSVLREDLYATISLAGGAAYLGFRQILGEPTATLAAFLLILLVRVVLLWRNPPRPDDAV
ncbi:trimeric intracellular cation channel family protein [Shimia sp. CNT1-13L.2]|uniref:trimeric intracellular cation channel family protein n=1 Tax=Shimia sp. CNT1-13L.2 TaxID=2959663 RepID=UPI0020CDDF63|nr:trimeric intracellular cation channel family protein [Shimia sp. CNT1-13L.2]MCP9481291.1 trimeric intracellular cation channel family protein [Shimia sp. CNT1-13L.2]